MREYSAARGLHSFLEFLSWIVIVAGAILAIAGAKMAGDSTSNEMRVLLAAVPGTLVCLIGLVLLALVQDGRASVDTAEMTGKMLKIAEEGLRLQKAQYQAAMVTPGATPWATLSSTPGYQAASPGAGAVPSETHTAAAAQHSDATPKAAGSLAQPAAEPSIAATPAGAGLPSPSDSDLRFALKRNRNRTI